MKLLHIGVDDTDSKGGMCTTYVGAVARDRLLAMGLREADYPSLVRLNPNCPYKTRGNAAIALHILCPEDMIGKAVETVVETVEQLYERGYRETQPGIAVYVGHEIPQELTSFSMRAVREMVSMEEALALAERHGLETYMINGGRGVIGAIAAIGYSFSESTYEAIAYRTRENWGTVRRLVKQSVYEMDQATRGRTFDNIDYETGEIRITPHTPCPVLAGVRALRPEDALEGLRMVKFLEPIERIVVYKTNQATDAHLVKKPVRDLKPYTNAIVEGHVVEKPVTIKGGHVFFKIDDGTGCVKCAVYEPTKKLRNITRQLIPGDYVRVMGGVKPKQDGLTLNVEKLEVIRLAEHTVEKPPICNTCRRTMKSKGRNKGYECPRCGAKKKDEEKRVIKLERVIKPGLYEATASARRHLSKPLELISAEH